MKFASAQNNLSSGELSPRLEGRNDIKEYFNGAAILQNFIPSREGGIKRRPGTRYLNTPTYNSGGLYGFIVDKKLSYLIQLSAISTSQLNCSIYKLAFSGSPSLTLVMTTTKSFAVGTFQDLDVNKFNVAQANNVMILTHVSGKVVPMVISRITDTYFTFQAYWNAVQNAGYSTFLASPYTSFNSTPTTMSYGGGVLTSTTDIFVSALLGATLKLRSGSSDQLFSITNILDAKNAVATEIVGAGSATYAPTREWAFESWNPVYGYPRSVAIFQERVCFGGTDYEPHTIWFGVAGNLWIIMNTKLLQDVSSDVSGLGYYGAWVASDAFQRTLSANRVNNIQWMTSDRHLQVGTASAEHAVSKIDGLFDDSHAQHTTLTFYGSNDSAAIPVGHSTVFVSGDGKSVRELSYSEENGSNVSRIVSSLAEHLTYHLIDEDTQSIYGTEITKLVHQASRGTVWCLTNNNSLVGFVLERSSETLAWHKHVIGGAGVSVLSIAITPDDQGDFDTLFMLVSRTINGSSVTHIEMLGDDFRATKMYGHYNAAGRNYPIYMDSMVLAAYVSPNNFTVAHLVGEVVVVVVKGINEGIQTAGVGGAIAVADATAGAGDVVVGLPYKSILKSMKIQEGSRIGDPQVLIKRIDTLLLTIENSKTCKVGSHVGNTETRILKDLDNVNLYDGEDTVLVDSSPDEEQRFYIETDSPFPLNISSIGIRGETQE